MGVRCETRRECRQPVRRGMRRAIACRPRGSGLAHKLCTSRLTLRLFRCILLNLLSGWICDWIRFHGDFICSKLDGRLAACQRIVPATSELRLAVPVKATQWASDAGFWGALSSLLSGSANTDASSESDLYGFMLAHWAPIDRCLLSQSTE